MPISTLDRVAANPVTRARVRLLWRLLITLVVSTSSAACFDVTTIHDAYFFYVQPGSALMAPAIRGKVAMLAGDSVQLIAIAESEGYGELGPAPRNIADSRITPAAFQWTSSDSAVATVGPSGLLVARAIGLASVSVGIGGVRSEPMALTVIPPVATFRLTGSVSPVTVGDTLRLSVAAVDAAGHEVPGVLFQLAPGEPAWTTFAPVGNIRWETSPASVSLRAAVPGSVVLSAQSGDWYAGRVISGTYAVTVVPR